MKLWDVVCIILHASMKEILGESPATTNIVDSSAGVVVCKDISFDEVTDGNNLTSAVFELPCHLSSAPLLIKLRPSDKLGSVSIFVGEGSNSANYLDYFLVSLNSDSKKSYRCGSWTEPFRVGRSMRVNCPLYGFVFDTVTIATDGDGFALEKQFVQISEIEVQTHEYSESTAFYGCYEIFEGKTVTLVATNSCKDLCYYGRNYFVSYRSNGSCMCGSNVPKSILPPEDCLPRCGMEDVLCGGPNAFAVYVARAPHIFSIGCYHSEVSRDVGVDDDDDVTPGRCIVKCAKLHKPFVYLFGSKHCACNDIKPKNMTSMEECSMNCSDGYKNCGGRNTSLVYTGCLSDAVEASCVDVYRCEDDNFDEFGVCQGQCEDGFMGSHCLERETPTNVNTPRGAGGDGNVQSDPAILAPTISTTAGHVGNTISTTAEHDENTTTTNETQRRVPHNVEALVFYKRDSVSISLIVIFLVTLALALIAIIFAALYFKEPELVREVSD